VEPSDTILRFLESIGRRSEAEFYLSLFRADSKERFALLAMEPAVLRQAFDALTLDLRFLAGLGLIPVVALGLYNTGNTVAEHAERLARRLARAEVPAVIHRAEGAALATAVTASARSGQIPLLPFAFAAGTNVEARWAALGDLAAALQTRKVIFLARRGGLRPRGADRDIPIVNLTTDYERLVSARTLPVRQLYLLAQSRRLLEERVSHRMLVAVTSPLSLLRDLFTVKGAGTLIKRGSHVLRCRTFEELDRDRLRALLCSSFGRAPSEGLFSAPVRAIYLEESYRGAAIVQPTPLGAYLTKFAVEREAQGEGIGRDLWQLLAADHPSLFWRARAANPIAPWYTQECDGMARFPDWHVFWRGLASERIPDAIAYALARPVDFPADG
jgi:acetylglutamate kinase